MKTGETVGGPWPQMQQGGRGFVEHPRVAVRSPGDDTFEKTEHATDVGLSIQGCDEVHLRGARVGEADLDSVVTQCLQQALARHSCHHLP